jgi:hypothetical protein
VYQLYNLMPFAWSNIDWWALLHQFPTLLAVCVVCSFGTSMDIMAVQAEVQDEIDADGEVAVVGWANVAAGIFTGGGPGACALVQHRQLMGNCLCAHFPPPTPPPPPQQRIITCTCAYLVEQAVSISATPSSATTNTSPGAGSVIFSQCVLAIRSGVKTRLQGYTLCALQFATFLLPFSLVHFLPNFYYGSLLMVIGVDIISEWLFATWPRVKKAEFVLSWLSFLATLVLTSLLPVQVCSRLTINGRFGCTHAFRILWHCLAYGGITAPLVDDAQGASDGHTCRHHPLGRRG